MTGLSDAEVRRFWWALGLPDAGDQAAYTRRDRDALLALTDQGLDTDTAVRLARAIGQNVPRMAEWQVAAMLAHLENIGEEATTARASEAFDELAPWLDRVVRHTWRRHLDTALTRIDPLAAGEVESAEVVTVGFADLVNFSALVNTLDTHRLGEMVEIFEARCADVVAAHDGRLIKTLGDAVLFVVPGDPTTDDEPANGGADRALRIAWSMVEVIGRDGRLPDVRLGLATGSVVTRMGDVFGSPVNLASRLTALARRNRVLADEATVSRLRGTYEVRRLSGRPVRGFGVVEPVSVRPV